MPAFDTNSPRIDLKVNGVPLKAPAPFAAGHVLSENEAKYLNRQVATSVANPIPSRIKEGTEGYVNTDGSALTPEQLQALYDTNYAAYELGQATRVGAPGEPVDPVERVLQRMGTDFINARLKAKGKNINEVKKAKDAAGNSIYNKLVSDAIAAHSAWRAAAEAQVAALAETVDDIDLDLGEPADETTPGEAAE